MTAGNAQCRLATLREELSNMLARLYGLMSDGVLEEQGRELLSKSQEVLASLGENQLCVKEELLTLREENLSLRQSIWDHERKDMVDPLEAIHARVKLEDIVKLKDDEIFNLRELHEVGNFEQEQHKKIIKIEKWIRRKFHKSEFFLHELKKHNWHSIRFRTLVNRFREWARRRPWRDEQLMFGERSEKGTSTPFSNYSSFDSYDTNNPKTTSKPVEQVVFSNAEGFAVRGGESYNRPSERTNLKSKSCFSKSLSLLERARREFDSAAEEESRMTRGRDVVARDLVNLTTSGGQDVTSV